MLFGVGRTVVPPAEVVRVWYFVHRECPLGQMRHIAHDCPDLGCEGPVTVHHCTLGGQMGLPGCCSCKLELLALRLWPTPRFVILGSPFRGYSY